MTRTIAYVVILVLATTAVADQMSGGKATIVPANKLKYEPVPGFKGAAMATIDGDPSKGPSHFEIRFDKGFSAPIHHHTADHFVTVVSGTVEITVDGRAHTLPAGSFFAFTGAKPHATRCAGDTACVLAIDSRGTWDIVPEAAASTP